MLYKGPFCAMIVIDKIKSRLEDENKTNTSFIHV